MGSDSFRDLSGSQVDKVEAVISEFVTKGEESLGNIEIGFVEHDALRCRESEISPPELKKETLLRDLECGCVYGEVVGDVSEGTSVLGNFCDVDGMNKVVRELWARNSGKMKDGNGKTKVADGGNEGFDLRSSLKIAVIDDTAVVDQVPSREFRGMVKKKIGVLSGPKNQKEIVDGEMGLDGKKARQAWRKAKSLHGSEEMLGKQENANARSQNMAGHKLMYSIKEMEALRFVNVIEQRRFWRRVYDGLGPVAKEYVSLLSCYDKNYQHTQPELNFDCIQQSLRREQAPVILGVKLTPSKQQVLNSGTHVRTGEIVSLPDPLSILEPCALNEGPATSEIEERCEDGEDDDEYYACIQRPAFFVEGEPNFNAGRTSSI